MKRIICFFLIVLSIGWLNLAAQSVNNTALSSTPKTLFPYPTVPDTIKTLENRSNYFVAKFWDNFDFSKPVKDIVAFDSAFGDYVTFFRYAHRNIVKSSISDVMNKAQSNMKNFWIFVDAAEKNLYSTDAILPSDEAYILFLNSVLRSSKVKKQEKERYQKQLVKINTNQNGNYAPNFEFTDVLGNKQVLDSVKAETIIVFFNNPDCDDCKIAKLRLSTNVVLNKLIDEKKVALVSIYPGKYSKEWAEEASKDSNKWIIGAWEGADEVYDLRIMPNIYILSSDKKIITKQVQVESLINFLNP